MVKEIEKDIAHFEEDFEKLRIETLLSGEYDSCNAIMTLHAGTGGTEACDWVNMLYRMYTRWFQTKGFSVQVLDYLDGDITGIKNITFEVGKPYTLSVWVKGDGNADIRRYFDGNGDWIDKGGFEPEQTAPTKWTRIYVVFKCNDTTFLAPRFENGVEGATLKFYGFKLEEGNKATDWTPAPEDTQEQLDAHTAQITTTNNKVASIETNLSSITSRVSSVEQTQVSTNGKVTSLETWKKDAEQKITSDAIVSTVTSSKTYKDNLTGKVSTNQIISSINQTAEAVKIQANKIDLTGDLDLQGQFKCWKNNSNKTGSYLYAQGAMLRGYKDTSQNKPTFACGLWKGMNNASNTPLGYVSVGLTNAVDSDNNGCLWMSPIADNTNNWYGTTLSFSRKLDSTGEYVRSAIDFNASGKLEFKCFDSNKQTSGYAGYIFDAGISCYSLTAHDLYARKCRTREIYPEQNGYYSIGNASARYTDAFIDTVSTTNTDFKIGTVKSTGAWEQYGALSINSKDGYVHPANTGGALSLGKSTNRFHMLYSVGNVNVSSDERLKTDIHYLDEPMPDEPVVIDNRVERNIHITSKDMYDFVRDDLRLASYRYNANLEKDNTSVDYGFIAQDILYTKVGSEIVQLADKNDLNSELSYNQGNYISVIAGALQEEIKKRDEENKELKNEIEILKAQVSKLLSVNINNK